MTLETIWAGMPHHLGDKPGLRNLKPRSIHAKRIAFRECVFALMRDETALSIFAEHGLSPQERPEGLRWWSDYPMSDEQRMWATHAAAQACFQHPSLRGLFDQYGFQPYPNREVLA